MGLSVLVSNSAGGQRGNASMVSAACMSGELGEESQRRLEAGKREVRAHTHASKLVEQLASSSIAQATPQQGRGAGSHEAVSFPSNQGKGSELTVK